MESVLVFSTHGYQPCTKILNLNYFAAAYIGEPIMTKIPWLGARFRHGKSAIIMEHKVIHLHKRHFSLATVHRIAATLESLTDPDTGDQIVARVKLAEEYYPNSVTRPYYSLLLELASGYSARNGLLDAPLLSPVSCNHSYLNGTHKSGGFFIWSQPGVRAQRRSADWLDLPPAILQGLGVPVPPSMQNSQGQNSPLVETDIHQPK